MNALWSFNTSLYLSAGGCLCLCEPALLTQISSHSHNIEQEHFFHFWKGEGAGKAAWCKWLNYRFVTWLKVGGKGLREVNIKSMQCPQKGWKQKSGSLGACGVWFPSCKWAGFLPANADAPPSFSTHTNMQIWHTNTSQSRFLHLTRSPLGPQCSPRSHTAGRHPSSYITAGLILLRPDAALMFLSFFLL